MLKKILNNEVINDKGEELIMNCDTIIIDGKLYEYDFTENNVHIENSCEVSKKFFTSALVGIETAHPDLNVWKRSEKSLKREWATHNLCYKLGLWRRQTKDVDLNYPQKWYIQALYWIAGNIALLLCK